MTSFLLLFLIVLGINLLPAFGPPTWSIIVFYGLNSDLPIASIVIVSALAAALGRLLLAHIHCKRMRSWTSRLQDVSDLMRDRHLKNIPVVDGDNRPIGVLTARAVLSVLLSDVEYEEAQLVDYVKGVGYR